MYALSYGNIEIKCCNISYTLSVIKWRPFLRLLKSTKISRMQLQNYSIQVVNLKGVVVIIILRRKIELKTELKIIKFEKNN